MLMFLKENRDGTIKARGYADRRKKREKYNNADATSPMVSTEAVLIYAVIDTYKEHNMEVVNIPGTYLSADMDNEIFMIFRGTMEEFMVAEDPALYQNNILYGKRGEALLYVSVQKALCGCLKSALISTRNWLANWNHMDFI